MTINSVTSTQSTPAASSVSKPAATDEAQARFMKLLIAQMKNQDPTNPMDNSQLTSQISQLNMVTGINQLNTTMNSIAGGVQSGQSLKAAGLLGHSVLVPGASLQLSQGQAVMGMELPDAADEVKVTVRNSAGAVVHTMNLGSQPAGLQNLAWDGVKDDGQPAADGAYSFEVEAVQGDQAITATSLALGKVDHVSLTSSGVVKISVLNVGEVGLADVREIR